MGGLGSAELQPRHHSPNVGGSMILESDHRPKRMGEPMPKVVRSSISHQKLDRDRATAEAVEERREADMRSFLDAQREARLDYLSDGLLNWQDIFRPFGEAARGLATGPLTRFLNTNTFFRAPAVTEEAPKLVEPLGEPYFSTGELPRNRWVATLPSPHALAV